MEAGASSSENLWRGVYFIQESKVSVSAAGKES